MTEVRCKVRLSDGSVMGPMDGPTLRTWYDQGFIDDDTPALGPGGRNWAPLSSVVDVSEWQKEKARPPGRPAAKGRRSQEEEEEEYESAGTPGRWRTVAASLLLLLGAAGAGVLIFRPQLWTPHLAGAPWREIALGLLALGLLLLRGWNWGRVLVRVVAVLGAIAALALMGPVLAQDADRVALLILACVWVLAFALSVFLSPSLSTVGSVLSLLVVLAALGGIGYLGYVPPALPVAPSAAAPVPAPTPSP